MDFQLQFLLNDINFFISGCIYGLGMGKNEIYKPLERLEKKVSNTQRLRASDIQYATGKYM